MKVSDFKLLSNLPEEYDYELFNLNDRDYVIGKKHQTIIGFLIMENELVPVEFKNKNGEDFIKCQT